MSKPYDYAVTCGVFDLLHEGHVALFDLMREQADEIFVIVHDDFSTFKNKKRFPFQGLEVRERNVANFADVTARVTTPDPSIKLDSVLFNLSKDGSRVVYVRGDDWPDFPGRRAVEKLGVPIVLKPYSPGVSSSLRRDQAVFGGCGHLKDGDICSRCRDR